MAYVTKKQAIENLASVIVQKAVADYKLAYSAYLRNPWDNEIRARLDELRVFFNGQWYGCLTTLDADYLIAQVEAECKKKHKLKEALMNRRKENEWK